MVSLPYKPNTLILRSPGSQPPLDKVCVFLHLYLLKIHNRCTDFYGFQGFSINNHFLSEQAIVPEIVKAHGRVCDLD
jgi:hypothetical protein